MHLQNNLHGTTQGFNVLTITYTILNNLPVLTRNGMSSTITFFWGEDHSIQELKKNKIIKKSQAK